MVAYRARVRAALSSHAVRLPSGSGLVLNEDGVITGKQHQTAGGRVHRTYLGPLRPRSTTGAPSLTPLERQVVGIRRAHPGVLLMVEVGYRYRFFGKDARCAAQTLQIVAHRLGGSAGQGPGQEADRGIAGSAAGAPSTTPPTTKQYLTASVPTYRIGLHLRRLVDAGYLVGVVAQVETARVKAASTGSSRSGPFERVLVAVYSRATLVDSLACEQGSGASSQVGRGRSAWTWRSGAAGWPGRGTSSAQRPEDLAEDSGALFSRRNNRIAALLELLEPAAWQARVAAGRRAVEPGKRPLTDLEVLCGGVTGPRPYGGAVGRTAGDACGGPCAGGGRSGASLPHVRLAVALLNVGTGELTTRVFEDGPARSELETWLWHVGPAEIVLAPHALVSAETLTAVAAFAQRGGTGVGQLAPALGAATAWTGTASVGPGDRPASVAVVHLPFSMDPLPAESPAGPLAPSESAGLARLLHALSKYLALFGLAELVVPPSSAPTGDRGPTTLRLDAMALRNLCLFGTGDGPWTVLSRTRGATVLGILHHCLTPMGLRRLSGWLAAPLSAAEAIRERQAAVGYLRDRLGSCPSFGQALKTALRQCVDLERGVARMRQGRSRPAEVVRVLRSAIDLGAALQDLGERGVLGAGEAKARSAPPALRDCLDAVPRDAPAILTRLLQGFDAVGAETGRIEDLFVGHVPAGLPAVGGGLDSGTGTRNRPPATAVALRLPFPASAVPALAQVATALLRRASADRALATCLETARTVLNDPDLEYRSVSNETHLLAVARSRVVGGRGKRAAPPVTVPPDWVQVSATKQELRYRSPEIVSALGDRALGVEELLVASRAAWRQFVRAALGAPYGPTLRALAEAAGLLDAWRSLALTALLPGWVEPRVLDRGPSLPATGAAAPGGGGRTVVCVEEGVHPLLAHVLPAGTVCVPNSAYLDSRPDAAPLVSPVSAGLSGQRSRTLVVTGPNMNGKSSLLRMVATLVVLAQLGSHVPAAAMAWTPVSGMFLRIGAHDDVLAGQSTFLVELRGALRILRHADERTLVLLDELGRGTSPGDGAALAVGTLQFLATRLRSPCLFSTHFPAVTQLEPLLSPQIIRCMRIAFHVVRDQAPPSGPEAKSGLGADGALRPADPRILLLYRLEPGLSTESHGHAAAAAAGLPRAVLSDAHSASLRYAHMVSRAVLSSPHTLTRVLKALAAATPAAPTHGETAHPTPSERRLLALHRLIQQLAQCA